MTTDKYSIPVDMGHKFAVKGPQTIVGLFETKESIVQEVADCLNRNSNLQPEDPSLNRGEGPHLRDICSFWKYHSKSLNNI